jgi:hypothetical protein
MKTTSSTTKKFSSNKPGTYSKDNKNVTLTNREFQICENKEMKATWTKRHNCCMKKRETRSWRECFIRSIVERI